MTVTAIVMNTGSEPVKVLKAGSVLDSDLPIRSLFVNKGDSKADSSSLTENNYLTIEPGSSIRANHDQSCSAFSRATERATSASSPYRFQIPDVAANKVKSISEFSKVEVQANSATVSLSSEPLASRAHNEARRGLQVELHRPERHRARDHRVGLHRLELGLCPPHLLVRLELCLGRRRHGLRRRRARQL
ncbi:hypothetical protein BD626DRAFT_586519 [Schizophyllum amplum]|uniref:Uncharacterized protein n=1 Tax=Schizophyllum amplum TaxID=97359 RepID=A0A550BYY1_9AGAR|nr:hypothetical protein BD626DRAFT_586519 [Auriculariopsis ampla]